MTEPLTYAPPSAPPDLPAAPAPRTGRTIRVWDPEDPVFWSSTGRATARRNLIVSIFAEHIAFSVWSLWSVFVLFLTPRYGVSANPADAAAQKFLLTAVPTAAGAGLRLPYTVAVAKFGGRNWTVLSAAALLVPTLAAAVLLRPGVTFPTLLALSALAGVGGGNFASSMTNINSFYPQRRKGAALGLNAGGGNVGVATVQLVGLAVLATAGAAHPRVLLAIYIPLIVLAALAAAVFMDNLAPVTNDRRAMRDVSRDPHTAVISLLYIGTFGSFIGFGFAFGQVLAGQFPSHFWGSALVHGRHVVDPVKVAYLTFLGPLVGSLIRPLGGALADRIGGARTTLWNFVAMAGAAGLVLVASREKSLVLFFVGFLALFVFSGVGNGSTYKMIPSVFRQRAARCVEAGGDPVQAEREARRRSGGVIGIAASVGAFGGVGVNIAFRQSFLTTGSGDAAYLGFIGFYLLCVAVTWVVYLRPSQRSRWI